MDLDKKENPEKTDNSEKETKKRYNFGFFGCLIDICCQIVGGILNFIGNLSQFFGA
ncbi:hypothetical protein ACN4EE_22005 [Geminocystis sp. CENA526]|uniref:hypothetical protein n=1 Tax=Geminocystis sp. CENA526 TaxID=1355871 RepID=UPI003D6F39EF